MTRIDLDHCIVPCRDQAASAKRLADLLGVAWSAETVGPFAAVFVNDGLTLDFQTTDEAYPVYHFCFRVDDPTFDAILARLRAGGIAIRSLVHQPVDGQVGRWGGGRNVYWNEPDGHQWEMLTVSYARPLAGAR